MRRKALSLGLAAALLLCDGTQKNERMAVALVQAAAASTVQSSTASPESGSITPEQFGLTRCEKADLVGGAPAENAAITRAILAGEKGPKRDAVLLNAGASLYIGGKADTMADGIQLAARLIDSGKAAAVLEKFIEVSNRPEENA